MYELYFNEADFWKQIKFEDWKKLFEYSTKVNLCMFIGCSLFKT